MEMIVGDIFTWFYELLINSVKYKGSNIDAEIPNLTTLGILFGTGLVVSIVMMFVFRKLKMGVLGFLGYLIVGTLGSIFGTYLFILYIYGVNPTETAIFTLDNTWNLNFVTASAVGGLGVSLILSYLFGLICSLVAMVIPKKAAA